MGQTCFLCDKKTTFGNTYVERGKPKYLGGNGRKTTGITRRTFKPNLQKINMQIGEGAARVRVCVKCMRDGLRTGRTDNVLHKKVVRALFTVGEVSLD